MTPVKGEIPVHLLEVIVVQRLEYLKLVLKGENITYNEYLIEDSLYDNVGHFTLCIVAILNGNREFLMFLKKTETELFRLRTNLFSTYELRCFAKKLLKTIKKIVTELSFVNSLEILCQHLVLKHMAKHILTHAKKCCEHKINIPFKQCLSFVANRQVELSNGVALVPCSKWKQYLVSLFEEYMNYKLKTNIRRVGVDPRIKNLVNRLEKEFIPSLLNQGNILLCKDVDNVSKYFPLCMLNLHQILRQKHRLSHSQRFYYTLFLKSIGMPVQEAIEFWKAEYTQSPDGNHRCSHSWEQDEKKFVYGIRHMYGLEGARKNYVSVNCHRIQSMDNCAEGGCPFKYFDDKKLFKLLENHSQISMSQLYELKKKKQYTSACMLTLNNFEECDNYRFNFTPVKYFSLTVKQNPLHEINE